MRKLWPALRPYRFWFLLLVGLVYVLVMADLKLPDYMARIVNEGIVRQDNSLILELGLRMLAVSLIGAVCTVLVSFLAARIAVGFSTRVREMLFEQVESFSLAEFNQFSTASLLTRTTNDIQQMQVVLVMLLRIVLMAPMMGLGGIIKAIQTAPALTWIMGLGVAGLLIMVGTMFIIGLPKFKLAQELVDKLNQVSRQMLTGQKVIRAFGTQKAEEEQFDKTNLDLTKVNLFVNRLMVIVHPFMLLVMDFAALGVIWFGSLQVDAGDLQIGSMMAFMQYAMQVIFSFLMVSMVFIMLPRATVAAQRVAQVLELKPTVTDPPQPQSWPEGARGEVEFRDVSYAFPNATSPVLNSISFVARPGQTTAVIGSTGSGKSTLVNLIPRFFDVTAGQILIDGVDIRQVRQSDLHDRLGYVPQKGSLFSGQVLSNLRYGAPQAGLDQVQKAAEIAQAEEFIKLMPQKYASPIAQGGANVSGGQRQRLAIARALVKDADILIFDDSFSALDFQTDSNLRADLKKHLHDKTILIVAQRINTVVDADLIIVLDNGQIVGQGNHQELLGTCQVYREIAQSQLSDEELGHKVKN